MVDAADTYDVIICGLGPVGQLLALALSDRGVRTLALEARDAPYELPRAAVIDDEVLRILQDVGLDRAVLEQSQVQACASIVTAAGRAVRVLNAERGLLGHPPLVSINQPAIERTMLGALDGRELVRVQWGSAVEVVDRRADHVDVWWRPVGGGASRCARAAYVVGCDGGGSLVRAQLGIGFAGRTAPQRWVVVDATVDRPLAKVPHPHFIGDRARPTVTLPMSPLRHRWEWMVHPGEDPSPLLEPAAIRAAIAPWLDGEQVEIERAVVYTFHTRMAERWRRGRVFLAGDAAHLMPPFVGQGFSSGARDAANLAWKLAEVLRGAHPGLLDSYEAERRPHVAAMQRLANAMGGLVQPTARGRVVARDVVLDALDGTAAHRWLTQHVKPLPSYGAGAFAERPARLPLRRVVGTLFPQHGRLDDRLPRGWVALTADPVVRRAFEARGLAVVAPAGDGAWLRARGVAFAILRPDRFVFAAGGVGDVPAALVAWRSVARPVGAGVAREPESARASHLRVVAA